jgi:hypothetical protein
MDPATATTALAVIDEAAETWAERVARENRELLHESRQPVPVGLEFVLTQVEAVEAAEAKGKKLYKAKVFHCDKKNQNYRIYPREVMQENVDRLKDLLGQGYLAGAVDHAYWGNLADTCLIWRSLWIDADGAGYGTFEIIDTEGPGGGINLEKQIRAGLAIGFSIMGYGTGHEPGDSERDKYKLHKDEYAVVMDPNYVLKKIDSVDDPAVHDARLQESRARASRLRGQPNAGESSGEEPPQRGAQENQNMDIKTLDDLKAKLPDVFKLHEAAVTKAAADATAAADAKLKPFVDAFSETLKVAKDVAGVALPEREVLPAETATRIDTLGGQIKALEAEKASLAATVAAKDATIATFTAEKADGERRAKAQAKLDALLTKDGKDVPYAALIRADADDRLGDASFTEDKVEAFVTARGKRYADSGLAPAPAQPRKGTSGAAIDGDELAEHDRAEDSVTGGAGGDDEFGDAALGDAVGKLNAYAESRGKKPAPAAGSSK